MLHLTVSLSTTAIVVGTLTRRIALSQLAIPVLILLLSATHTDAQRTGEWHRPDSVRLLSIGALAAFNSVGHSGSFLIPDAPTCCTEYTTSRRGLTALGGFIRYEVARTVRVGLRGLTSPLHGSFETSENILLTGQVQGKSNHELDVLITALSVELYADVGIVSGLRVIGGIGATFMSNATYEQREVLVSPADGTFENDRRVRMESGTRDLQNLNVPVIYPLIGLGWDLPLSRSEAVVLTPEVTFLPGIQDIVKDLNWKVSSLRMAVNIAVALNPPVPPIPVEFRNELTVDSVLVDVAPEETYRRMAGREVVTIDTAKSSSLILITRFTHRVDTVYSPVPPNVTAAIAARAINADGSRSQVFTIGVTTQFVNEALPVLPVVFFEAQSISLSFRYRRESNPDGFRYEGLKPRTTDVHRDVLNILGKRLRDNPAPTIRLRGTADPTTEGASCDMALRRAETVRDYLVNTWKIAPERLQVITGTASCAPANVTRQQSEEGYSENRRVEIETDDLTLLESVGRRRFNEARDVNPPSIEFDPTGTSERWVQSWTLKARSGSDTILERAETGKPSIIRLDLTPTQADAFSGAVEVDFEVEAIRNITANAKASIPVKRDTLAVELERLTLTLFDVSSDKITSIAERNITRFVDAIPAGSSVIVRGYADMLGNAEFNRKISARRAQAVCDVLRRRITRNVDIRCDEVATDRFPPGISSYDTPEERFLSRTVQIEVRRRR